MVVTEWYKDVKRAMFSESVGVVIFGCVVVDVVLPIVEPA